MRPYTPRCIYIQFIFRKHFFFAKKYPTFYLQVQINRNLEELARLIYDYWFVQFDFPNKNGKPYKSSGGKMMWNEALKREIPNGWSFGKIKELEPEIVTGKTPSTLVEDNFGGEIPFITIDDIRQAKYINNTERTLTEKGADSQKTKYIPANSLCCSCIGTVGVIGFNELISQLSI